MKLIITILLPIISLSSAIACTCANQTPEEMLLNSDAVILAISNNDSITIAREMSDEEDWVGEIGVYTEFEVVSDYKNTELKSINVISPLEEERCGINFKKDDLVILSTMRHPTTFEMVTSTCSVSRLDNPEAYNLLIELEKLSKNSN